MAIERPPSIHEEELIKAIITLPDRQIEEIVESINEKYEYWDVVKYRKCHKGYTPTLLWTYVKASRMKKSMRVWDEFGVNLCLTNMMQRKCHEFDILWGGCWGADSPIHFDNKEHYLISSLMEEAIFSSQMEGAATTRKVAKEMLRKQMIPRDKSQQMIHNNYQTIQFIESVFENP